MRLSSSARRACASRGRRGRPNFTGRNLSSIACGHRGCWLDVSDGLGFSWFQQSKIRSSKRKSGEVDHDGAAKLLCSVGRVDPRDVGGARAIYRQGMAGRAEQATVRRHLQRLPRHQPGPRRLYARGLAHGRAHDAEYARGRSRRGMGRDDRLPHQEFPGAHAAGGGHHRWSGEGQDRDVGCADAGLASARSARPPATARSGGAASSPTSSAGSIRRPARSGNIR